MNNEVLNIRNEISTCGVDLLSNARKWYMGGVVDGKMIDYLAIEIYNGERHYLKTLEEAKVLIEKIKQNESIKK